MLYQAWVILYVIRIKRYNQEWVKPLMYLMLLKAGLRCHRKHDASSQFEKAALLLLVLALHLPMSLKAASMEPL